MGIELMAEKQATATKKEAGDQDLVTLEVVDDTSVVDIATAAAAAIAAAKFSSSSRRKRGSPSSGSQCSWVSTA